MFSLHLEMWEHISSKSIKNETDKRGRGGGVVFVSLKYQEASPLTSPAYLAVISTTLVFCLEATFCPAALFPCLTGICEQGLIS